MIQDDAPATTLRRSRRKKIFFFGGARNSRRGRRERTSRTNGQFPPMADPASSKAVRGDPRGVGSNGLLCRSRIRGAVHLSRPESPGISCCRFRLVTQKKKRESSSPSYPARPSGWRNKTPPTHLAQESPIVYLTEARSAPNSTATTN